MGNISPFSDFNHRLNINAFRVNTGPFGRRAVDLGASMTGFGIKSLMSERGG